MRSAWTLNGQSIDTPRLLVVVAHPDDETMFFAPSILALARRGIELHVLCLSTGDYDGLGAVRATELPRACECLDVPAHRVHIRDDPKLRDGPHAHWPVEHIAALVAAELDVIGASRVLTFDAHGVSRHPNHVAVHRGVRLVATHCRSTAPVIFELRSTGLLRRFIGLCAAPLAVLWWWWWHCRRLVAKPRAGETDTVLCVSLNPWRVHRAMVQHWSQYVWFRRLYVVLSRYVWVNELARNGLDELKPLLTLNEDRGYEAARIELRKAPVSGIRKACSKILTLLPEKSAALKSKTAAYDAIKSSLQVLDDGCRPDIKTRPDLLGVLAQLQRDLDGFSAGLGVQAATD